MQGGAMVLSIARVCWIGAAILAAGSTTGCERRMLERGGSGQLGGSQGTGPLGTGAGAGTGTGAAGAAGGLACDRVELAAPPSALDVLLIVTASASMARDATNMSCTPDCGASSRWAIVTGGINGAVQQMESSANWGLQLAPEDATSCTVARTLTVPIAPANAGAIATALASRTSGNGGLVSGGNTPIRAAEEFARVHLSGLVDGRRKLIVLVTDGPSSCPPDGAGAVDDADLAVEVIAQTADKGFPTYVVGIAPADVTTDEALDRMAAPGDTGRPYFFAVGASQLAASLREIVDENARCTFAIPPPPTNDGTHYRSAISVEINGRYIQRDDTHATGWAYTDDSMLHLRFHGQSCAVLRSEPASVVTVGYLCLLGV
jgi:hypothetical protein